MVESAKHNPFDWASERRMRFPDRKPLLEKFMTAAEELLGPDHFLIASEANRRELLEAAVRYHMRKQRPYQFKRKHLRQIVEELKTLRSKVDRAADALMKTKLFHFDQHSTVSSIDTWDQVEKALFELDELIWIAEEHASSISQKFGDDDSGPLPLSAKLIGDPLDHFLIEIAQIWQAQGLTLSGGEADEFLQLAGMLYEALTGKLADAGLPNEALRLTKLRKFLSSSES